MTSQRSMNFAFQTARRRMEDFPLLSSSMVQIRLGAKDLPAFHHDRPASATTQLR